MIDRIAPYLPYYPYALGAWLGVSLLLLLAAWYNIRRRKTADVWRTRHRADQRGQRLLIWSLSSLIAAVMVSLLSGSVIFAFGYVEEFFPPRNPYDVTGVAVAVLPTEDPNRTRTPTFTPSSTFTRTPTTPTPTRPPSRTPFPTDTQTPSVTPTQTHTATPAPTRSPLERLGIERPVTARQVPENASLRLLAVDDEITENDTPPSPGTAFDIGTETLYFFTTFRNMVDDIAWSWVLFRNGIPVEGDAMLWRSGTNGVDYFRLTVAESGYPPGDYEIRLYLNNQEVDSASFTVTVAAADSVPGE